MIKNRIMVSHFKRLCHRCGGGCAFGVQNSKTAGNRSLVSFSSPLFFNLSPRYRHCSTTPWRAVTVDQRCCDNAVLLSDRMCFP